MKLGLGNDGGCDLFSMFLVVSQCVGYHQGKKTFSG